MRQAHIRFFAIQQLLGLGLCLQLVVLLLLVLLTRQAKVNQLTDVVGLTNVSPRTWMIEGVHTDGIQQKSCLMGEKLDG